jgi:PBP1b-binding outer membrane lipoprotein LpoB
MKMNARKSLMSLMLLMVLMLVLAACGSPAAAPAPPAPAAQPTMASAPQPTEAPAADQTSANLPNAAPRSSIRMIIKNGEMTLVVADTDRALDQATGIAVNSGGYVISSKTWNSGDRKSATLTMGVPSDQFEAVQRQLRALAVEVLSDTSSGQDVSDEFVDLQARLTNLEATAARIRELLKDAKDVDEALQVNIKLSEVESEIEQIKGRMQYLKDRSAFSTIVVNLQPDVLTPTPEAWQPGKTVENAAKSAGNLLRGLIDGAIWLVVALGPVLILLAIVVWLIVRAQRKRAKRGAMVSTTPGDK